MSQPTIGLVGNPNCGKTTLFNALTGANQHVGNWPGVTVERKEGNYQHQNRKIVVVDLPGVYSLDVEESTTGLDELVARDYLLSGTADVVVNIVDASNLERNLYLTTQLLEMGVPMVIVLNMMDLAAKREIRIDPALLSQRLGCPVLPISATSKKGLPQLKDALDRALDRPLVPQTSVAYPPVIEDALADLTPILAAQAGGNGANARWFGLNLLQYDDRHLPDLGQDVLRRIGEHRHRIHQTLGEDTDLLIADSRYTWIRQLIQGVCERTNIVKQTVSDKIDRVVLNRWLGIPIFLAVMYLMFLVSINLGGAFIDLFDLGMGTIFVDGTAHLLAQVNAPGWLIGILANGVGGGIQVTSTFIPQIGLLFVFLALLEDSGYLARAAFVMDRLMQFVGLPGKSFVPMMVGFGCNIPGIMATRTLENRRDRLMTVMMNPFMSCGARLPVYALFCAAFFPTNGQNVVFILYILGILAAVFTGLVMSKTLFKGDAAPFIMELPPYHLPTFKGILLRAWDRLKAFITKAGKMIVVMVVILGMMNSVGMDGSIGKKDTQDSILSAFGRTATPVFAPMGIRQENWPATVGLMTGVFAKEVMVATMDSLYTSLGEKEAAAAGEPPAKYDFWDGMGKAVASVPEKLGELGGQILDPLGFNILNDVGDQTAAAASQSVKATTYGQMATRFGSSSAAIAYLLFVLLYFPCVAATAAVYRETNLGWTIFVGCWTTGLAYWVAVLYYQVMTFSEHPASSMGWVVGLAVTMLGTLFGLKRFSDRHQIKTRPEINSSPLGNR
ncbi:Fe(2+) transporter permease subunit FeoB [Chamaesiphon sp.]|uniref:Fe(2+) transporter permease subunit FeoB n=1 Tax=Chamaesiphon sp. TaxID=2814140 RepID=UPI00359353E1